MHRGQQGRAQNVRHENKGPASYLQSHLCKKILIVDFSVGVKKYEEMYGNVFKRD